MKLSKIIKDLNRNYGSKIMGTAKYWKRSPSGILLYNFSEKKLAKYAKNKDVLDVGAGRLAYKRLINKYAKSYTSSDFTKTHPDLDVVCDIEKLAFKENEFDVVFCSQVLEHVPHPQKALQEIKRVLEKKGKVIITVPMLGYIHNAPYDFYRYTKYGLELMAKETGFKVLELEEIGGLFSFLGYVRSTFLMSLFAIPVLGDLILYFNYLLSKIDIFLDKITKNKKIFPLNYLMILEKVK